jgi:hypothetical protein
LCILLILGYIQEEKRTKSGNPTDKAKATNVNQGRSNSNPLNGTYATPPQFCIAPANNIEEPVNKHLFNPFQITSSFINGESLIRPLSSTEINDMASEVMSPTNTSLQLPNISTEKRV